MRKSRQTRMFTSAVTPLPGSERIYCTTRILAAIITDGPNGLGETKVALRDLQHLHACVHICMQELPHEGLLWLPETSIEVMANLSSDSAGVVWS